MNRYERVMARLNAGECILIDGATGTEVERRGVPQLTNAWNGGGALSHPDIVQSVHKDYIEAGAEIVISNTFATARHALRDAGVEKDFENYNRQAVTLAVEARDQMNAPAVLIAGGISYWSWTGDHPPLDELQESVCEQANVMRDAGADFLMLEMMIGIDRMLATLEGAQSSGLPVWVGLTCQPAEDGRIVLRNGEPLADAIDALSGKQVAVLNIMHTEVEHVDAALDVVDTHWDGLKGVYAHTGKHANHKWVFDDTITPDDYAVAAKRWLTRGVKVIGGCCGIRVLHIEALQRMLAAT